MTVHLSNDQMYMPKSWHRFRNTLSPFAMHVSRFFTQEASAGRCPVCPILLSLRALIYCFWREWITGSTEIRWRFTPILGRMKKKSRRGDYTTRLWQDNHVSWGWCCTKKIKLTWCFRDTGFENNVLLHLLLRHRCHTDRYQIVKKKISFHFTEKVPTGVFSLVLSLRRKIQCRWRSRPRLERTHPTFVLCTSFFTTRSYQCMSH